MAVIKQLYEDTFTQKIKITRSTEHCIYKANQRYLQYENINKIKMHTIYKIKIHKNINRKCNYYHNYQ